MDGTDDVFDTYLRLDEVAVCSESDATLALILAGKRGHHDDLDVFCLCSRTQDIEHVESADLWHHHVTDDEIRAILDSHGQRFFPVAS